MCGRSNSRFPAADAPAPQGEPVFQSHRNCHRWVTVCYLLTHLKRVLAECTLQEGALQEDPGQAELWATTNPTEVAGSLRNAGAEEAARPKQFVSYLFRQRIFISTSKGNVRLCNTGDQENEAFFFFLFPGDKCCEIVQEQPPVSTVTPAPRSFYITRWAVRVLGSGVGLVLGEARGEMVCMGLSPHLSLPLRQLSPSGLWEA